MNKISSALDQLVTGVSASVEVSELLGQYSGHWEPSTDITFSIFFNILINIAGFPAHIFL